MGLRIANNIAAMNAHRWLQTSDAGLSKSLERLSSGYRINKAADDAAGLAISQSFRADIASFNVAYRNTSEAGALLQVAEGGMDQIGNMLTRLKELATQASSANVGSSERTKIDAEGAALLNEIDRIANSSKYGSTALLDGTFGASETTTNYSAGDTNNRVFGEMTYVYSIAVNTNAHTSVLDMGVTITGMKSGIVSSTYTFSYVDGTHVNLGNGSITESISVTMSSTTAQTLAFTNLGLTITVNTTTQSAAWCGSQIYLQDTGLSSLNVVGADTGTYTFATAGTGAIVLGNGTSTETVSNLSPGTAATVTFSGLNISFDIGTVYTENNLEGLQFDVTSSGSSGSTFQIGAENNSNNRISITIGGARQSDLGLTSFDLSTASNAQAALSLIDTAISSLTSTRGDIGAYMNRLGYAASNLATTVENMQAAESVIRDVDMAAEMTMFTKNQIMMQAGTAMLAQANMMPQQVLALFG
jgi:flagellin